MFYPYIGQFFADLLSGDLDSLLPSFYHRGSYLSSQLPWVPNNLLKGRYSVTPLPSNSCWLIWWHIKGGHPSNLCHQASFPEYFDDILKIGLCHQTSCSGYPNDILKVTAYYLASYSSQYWWQGWLPYKGEALIVSNWQLIFLTAFCDNQGWQLHALTSGQSQIDT